MLSKARQQHPALKPTYSTLCVCLQLEQFNMENPSTSLALDPPGFSEGPGFLGGEGPVSGPQDPHTLNHQNVTHCSRHGSGPNIILTGERCGRCLRMEGGQDTLGGAAGDWVLGGGLGRVHEAWGPHSSLLSTQETPPQASPRRLQPPWPECQASRCQQLGWGWGWGWRRSCAWSHWAWRGSAC